MEIRPELAETEILFLLIIEYLYSLCLIHEMHFGVLFHQRGKIVKGIEFLLLILRIAVALPHHQSAGQN